MPATRSWPRSWGGGGRGRSIVFDKGNGQGQSLACFSYLQRGSINDFYCNENTRSLLPAPKESRLTEGNFETRLFLVAVSGPDQQPKHVCERSSGCSGRHRCGQQGPGFLSKAPPPDGELCFDL